MSEAEAVGPSFDWRPSPQRGWVAPLVAAEFPGLAISWIAVDGRVAKSPEPVRRRLRGLSDRFYGAHAVQMREQPIPWAYRVFFRHIGLDPDRTLIPVERLALERLHDGAFKSRGLPARRADDRDRRDRRRPASLRRRAGSRDGCASASPPPASRWPGSRES